MYHELPMSRQKQWQNIGSQDLEIIGTLYWAALSTLEQGFEVRY